MIQKICLWRVLLMILFASVLSCKKEAADNEYPIVDINYPNFFPKNCSKVSRGKSFTTVIKVYDNAELGSLSVDIHENFDHHTHSTEVDGCPEAPEKEPINPFSAIVAIPLPPQQTNYTAIKEIFIPADVDTGRYHFMIRLTDKAGWQTIKGIEINIE